MATFIFDESRVAAVPVAALDTHLAPQSVPNQRVIGDLD